MFGYVKPKNEELKIKDYAFYRATYCGICKRMKALLGTASTLTLTYDSVFLALLRMAYIPDAEIKSRLRRCAVHPIKKRDILEGNSAIDYTVRVFAELTYRKLEDDIEDERALRRLVKSIARPSARRFCMRARLDGSLSECIRSHLCEISEREREGCASVDLCAAPFGELLGEIFAYGIDDESAQVALREIGRQLGVFIYVADAAEDYEEDARLGRSNPFVKMYGAPSLSKEQKQNIHTALTYRIDRIASALAFIDFGARKTLERILYNIVQLGLRARIEFLSGE